MKQAIMNNLKKFVEEYNPNHVMRIEREGGHWILKFDGQFGWSYGFLKTGKKRVSGGMYQTGFLGRDDVEKAKDYFARAVDRIAG